MSSGRGKSIPRRLFTSVAISSVTIGLAGCLKGDDPQVRVYNARPNPVTVTIGVYDIESEPEQRVFNDRQTIPPSEVHEYMNLYGEGGMKRLFVRTEDGYEGQQEMEILSKSERGGGNGYLLVNIEEDGIEFKQALG
jgi:hypothetical protein